MPNAENQYFRELLSTVLGKEIEVNESLVPYELKNATIESLIMDGFTKKQAQKLIASVELGKLVYQVRLPRIATITSTKEAGRYLEDKMKDYQQEVFTVLFLSSKNHILKEIEIFKGSVNASVVHPREIFKEAVKYPTARMIVAHNHPSGDTEPSQADLVFTQRLIECGNVMGIELLDHFIVGQGFTSLRESTRMFS